MKKSIFLFFAAILCAIGMNAATWTVAGSDAKILNGTSTWDPSDTKNDMTNVSGTKWGLLVMNKSLAKTTYKFKVCKDHGWGTAYPGSDYNFTIGAAGTYNIIYRFNTNENTVGADYFKTWTVAGSGAVLTDDWKPEATANDMTRNGNTFEYVLTKKDVKLEKGTNYECKVCKDHAWGTAYPGDNHKFSVTTTGYYDVTFKFNVATETVEVTTTLINCKVTTSANPTEGGSVTATKEYAKGSDVTLTATPAEGYEFVNWTKDGAVVSTSKTYTFTVVEDVSLVANFKVPVPDVVKYQVTVSANDNTMGTVTGGGEYEEGTTALLTATPNSGYQFKNWTVAGAEVSTANPYTFTVNEDVTVTANFEETPKVTIYFVNNSDWSKIQAYAWEGTKGANPGWPGADITANKLGEQIGGFDVYSYTVEQGSYGKVIFNNGSAQTKDYVWTDGSYYWNNEAEGFAGGTKADAESKLSVPVEYEYVYLINTNDWAKAHIYTWTPEVAGWPGAAMTKEAEQIAGKDVYSYKVVKGTTFGGMNFNCGGDECKTGDLTWQAGQYYAPSKNEWYADAAAAEAALATPAVISYVLMGVKGDWTTGIPLVRNEENTEYEEYMLLGQEILAGDAVKVVTLTDGVATAWCGNVDVQSIELLGVTFDEKGNVVLAPGKYDFYYKVADDGIYIAGEAYPTTATVTVADPIGSMSTYTGVEYDESAETWSKVYHVGDEVTIGVAQLGEGWVFAYWTVGEEKIFTEEYTFIVAEDVTITATYATAMDVTFDNLVLDAESGLVEAGPDASYGIELILGIDMVNAHPKGFGLAEGSSISLGGNELELVTGYFTAIDVDAPSAEAVVMAVYEEMLMAFVCSMTAAAAPAYNVVVENAVLKDSIGFLFMNGTWSDGVIIYPVQAEIPGFDATVASATCMVTITVGGEGDDPWLGFGEGEATVTVESGVVTLTAHIENAWIGFKADVTISGTLPVVEEPETPDPENPDTPTSVDNVEATVAPVKMIENGQLIIINNGVQYNAQGAILK